MNDSKLIRLLSTLSKDEWKEFEKFAASPYFNKGRNYLAFVNLFKKIKHKIGSDKITKKFLYESVYPGKVYKEAVINTMLSGLYKLAEEFLLHNNFRNDSLRNRAFLIRQLSIKRLKSDADNFIKNTIRILNNNETISEKYYDKFFIYDEIYDHYFINDERSKLYDSMQISMLHLTRYFLYMLMLTENQLISTTNFSKRDYRKESLGKIMTLLNYDKLIRVLDNDDPTESTILKIYYNFLRATTNIHEDKYYYEAKKLIQNNFPKLSNDLKIRCYINLLNICSIKQLEGNEKWNRECFEIYKEILMYKLYYFTGGNIKEMPRRVFRNIITIAINCSEIEWTRNFIKSYIGETQIKFREVNYNYGMALVEFADKNFELSLHHLNKISQDQILYKIEVKNLLAKIYYETNSLEPLHSLLDTYLHLLKNSGITNFSLTKRHTSFIKYLRTLLGLKSRERKTFDIEKLAEKINTQKYVTSKLWLLKKIDELTHK